MCTAGRWTAGTTRIFCPRLSRNVPVEAFWVLSCTGPTWTRHWSTKRWRPTRPAPRATWKTVDTPTSCSMMCTSHGKDGGPIGRADAVDGCRALGCMATRGRAQVDGAVASVPAPPRRLPARVAATGKSCGLAPRLRWTPRGLGVGGPPRTSAKGPPWSVLLGLESPQLRRVSVMELTPDVFLQGGCSVLKPLLHLCWRPFHLRTFCHFMGPCPLACTAL
mmetsp:Transcript_56165/g.174168  ORF Transcript_56165/g.174168 Transcript_56165/m.174168 type:complete len:220 (-) Transcript_56165:137-796(-)